MQSSAVGLCCPGVRLLLERSALAIVAVAPIDSKASGELGQPRQQAPSMATMAMYEAGLIVVGGLPEMRRSAFSSMPGVHSSASLAGAAPKAAAVRERQTHACSSTCAGETQKVLQLAT